jgi:YesN/AraC family two-component response regulator
MIASTKALENVLLIVDDEPDIRLLLKSVFQYDYTIIEAEDGAQGVLMANEYLPNIIISDVMMPNLGGFELCKQLKATTTTSHIPIILLTAKTDDASKLQGLQLGATDFIIKPFLIAELKSKMSNLITLQNNVLQYLTNKYLVNITNTIEANSFTEPEQLVIENTNLLDSTFLNQVHNIVQQNFDKADFNIDQFANSLNISAVQLRRKLKAVSNVTPIEFLRNYRLNQAKVLLKKQDLNISEIAYATGFDSISYFSRVFHEAFAISPSEYREQL